jgi:hypothetical protein
MLPKLHLFRERFHGSENYYVLRQLMLLDLRSAAASTCSLKDKICRDIFLLEKSGYPGGSMKSYTSNLTRHGEPTTQLCHADKNPLGCTHLTTASVHMTKFSDKLYKEK